MSNDSLRAHPLGGGDPACVRSLGRETTP